IWASFAERLSEEHFQSAGGRKLFELLRGAGGDARRIAMASDDEKVVRGVSALALEPTLGEPTLEYAHDVWARLQELALKRRSDAIRQRLQKLTPTTETEEYDRLFQDLIATDGELRRLKDRRGAPVGRSVRAWVATPSVSYTS